jgi:hypothetical protein
MLTSQDLADKILRSKYSVVVIGTISSQVSLKLHPAETPKGAGVSAAACIPTFRGPGGLFDRKPGSEDILELFNNHTFEVRHFH